MPEEPLPTEEQVRGYLEACSNWGRWGPDDSAGTVNHVTPEKRREAAALVKTGRAVSISYPLNTVGGPGNWNPAQHFVRSLGQTAYTVRVREANGGPAAFQILVITLE